MLDIPSVLIGVATVVVAQFAFTYLPPLRAVFETQAVSVPDGIIIIAAGFALLLIVEFEKRLAAQSSGNA